MKITLPERLAGTKDALFVLEIEFPVATEGRTVEVGTTGAIEALDLRGTGPGGTYDVPVGVERLHVPMRVTDTAAGEATVVVKLTKGPDSPKHEEHTLLLEQGPTAPVASGAGGKLAVAAVLVALLGGAAFWLGPKLLGGDKVPQVAGQPELAATDALQKAEYVVDVQFEPVTSADKDGTVLRTIPAGGTKLAKGEKVKIVVGTSASPTEKVDAVVGQTADAAAAALKASGFQVLEHYVDARPGQTPGRVVRQSPGRGQNVPRGTEVEIWIARKPIEPTPPPIDPTPPPVDPTPPPIDPTPPPVDPTPPPVDPTPPPVDPTPPPVDPTPPPVDPTPPPVDPTPPPVDPTPPPVDPTPPPVDPTPPPVDPTPPSDNLVDVPNLSGKRLAEAEKQLERIGLFAIPEYEMTDDKAKHDTVLRQVPDPTTGGPENKRTTPGTQVFLTVGRYKDPTPPVDPTPPPVDPTPPPVDPTPPPVDPTPPPVDPTPPVDPAPPPVDPRPPVEVGKVPDLIGLSRERATGLVRASGFRFRVHLEETPDVPDGQVLSQKPGPGESLSGGGTVDLIVARRPTTSGLGVPDVVGKSRAEAERILRAQSFLVRTTWGGGSADEIGNVTGQEPAAGTPAERRTWVEIVIARGAGAHKEPTGGPPPSLPSTGGTQPVAPGDSGSITRPPAVGEGPVLEPPPTPRGVEPIPPVKLPPRDAPASIDVPDVSGQSARAAIEQVLAAGLIPIVEVDRSGTTPSGQVTRQSPKGTQARPGDLVRIGVHLASTTYERFTDVPATLGGLVRNARSRFMAGGSEVEVVEVSVPGHPYAGTGRIAAQYPVGSVPRSAAKRITFWVIR